MMSKQTGTGFGEGERNEREDRNGNERAGIPQFKQNQTKKGEQNTKKNTDTETRQRDNVRRWTNIG